MLSEVLTIFKYTNFYSEDAFQIANIIATLIIKAHKLTNYKINSYKMYALDKGNKLLMLEENYATMMKR